MSKRYYRETTHTCKARGCTRQVPKRYLMCRQHWYEVPPDVQAEVYAAWAEVQTSGTITERYARAARAAIDAVGSTPIRPPAQRVDQF